MNKLLLVIGFWLLANSAQAFDACDKNYTPIAQRYEKGLVFKLQKCGGGANFIMGTMHSDDPAITKMHKRGVGVMEMSQNAIFEIAFGSDAIKETLQLMYYPQSSEKTLQTEIGNKLYKKFEAIAPKEPTNIKLKPWAAAVMLQYPADKADGIDLDLRLKGHAQNHKINVIGLEKPSEQLKIFDSMPLDEQISMLTDILENYQANLEMQQEVTNAYLASDLKTMEKLIPKTIELSSDKKKAAALMKQLLDDRNIKMAQRSQKYLEQGGAFIAVGALHLPGEKGVLKLLEDKGYKIEVVY